MRFSPHWTFGIVMMALTARAESPAARGSCKGPQLKLDSYLKARKPWVSAVQSVSKRLSDYGEVDHCAVLDIQWMGSEAMGHASGPSGRSAIRHVSTPDALTSTVIALLALPDAPLALAAAATTAREAQDPAASGARSATAASTGKAVAAAHPHPGTHSGDDRDEPTTNLPMPALDMQQVEAEEVQDTGTEGRRSTSKSHPEIGAWTTAARVAGSDVYMAGLGAGAFGQFATGGWLLGGSVRAERLHNLNDHRDGAIDSQTVVMFGPTIGRRLTNGPVWVDAIIPLQLTFESSSVQPDASQPQTVDGTSYTDFRVGAMVRASWELTKSFRLFGSLDADVSPARLVNPPEVKTDPTTGAPVEQRPPRFSLGLSVGVFWGAF
jgi:hypothetical protein